MFSLEQILAVPPSKPVLPGSHSEFAERYRQEALFATARLRLFAELLDGDLRERPDDDRMTDATLQEIVASLRTIGAWIDAFRATRVIEGSA